jgi:hypothetical protein
MKNVCLFVWCLTKIQLSLKKVTLTIVKFGDNPRSRVITPTDLVIEII